MLHKFLFTVIVYNCTYFWDYPKIANTGEPRVVDIPYSMECQVLVLSSRLLYRSVLLKIYPENPTRDLIVYNH